LPRAVLPALLLFAGCNEYDLVNANRVEPGDLPDIRVHPPTLTWPTLRSDEVELRTFTVENVGGTPLHVSDIEVAAGLGFSIVTDDLELELDTAQSAEIEVAFTPMGAHENFGRVLVLSDDGDTPEAPVDLLGDGAVPELQITPEDYVFADAFVPCGDAVPLQLKNVGVEDLIVTDLQYRSTGMLSLDISGVALPLTLGPGETTDVAVDFVPATIGADSGTLSVTSNDPRGVVDAWQSGESIYVSGEEERFTEPGIPPVDVLMLIDQSCSMEEDNIDDVELGMPDFVSTLQEVADWQLIQVTGDSGCSNQGVLTPASVGTSDLLVDGAFGGPEPQFYDGVYRTEKLLELASIALAQTGPGGCNEGFVRHGALLHVLVISDEPEQSGIDPSLWIEEYTAYAVSEDFVRVSAVVDLYAQCGTFGGEGYVEAASATGGAMLDICTPSWGPDFKDVAVSIGDGVRSYNLAKTPDPPSVEVVVNGVATTDFVVTGTAVTVMSPPVGPGDVVDITYNALADCPS